ncbi:MAG: hypothetical protein KDI75_04790 [Xanthomonadales bacterium]|nr:hypothetical protein [Xanthomonadales bacterium]
MKPNQRPFALFLACSGAILLAACGGSGNGDGTSSAPTAPASQQEASTASTPAKQRADTGNLASFMGDNICDVLPVTALQQAFDAPADLKVQPSSFRKNFSCNYSWPRPDAEERQQAMMDEMMKNARRKAGEKVKLDLRKMSTDFSVSIMLQKSRATAANFIPPKLTEKQLQERIKVAAEAANKRLTDEQRKAIGKDGAEGIAGGMIRKTNERVEIEGLGDAAYWIPLMGGSLNVLDGTVHVSITPIMADDEQANIEAAKKIFTLLKR